MELLRAKFCLPITTQSPQCRSPLSADNSVQLGSAQTASGIPAGDQIHEVSVHITASTWEDVMGLQLLKGPQKPGGGWFAHKGPTLHLDQHQTAYMAHRNLHQLGHCTATSCTSATSLAESVLWEPTLVWVYQE